MKVLHIGKVADREGPSPAETTEDWLRRINLASAVANVESGLLSRDLAKRVVRAVEELASELEAGSRSPVDLYIQYEPLMLAKTGPEASVLHVGRSSQDMLATAWLGANRAAAVRFGLALNSLRRALLALAKREENAIVPSYTNGVQAQATLYAHYLLAQADVFGRDLERVFEFLRRYSASPMGSCVLNGSSWPLDCERMAELLGFEGVAANAFDAGQCQGNDVPLELSQIVSSAMLHIGSFLADFSQQYAQVSPWLVLTSQNGVYASSAMPQKRNPGLLNDCRRDAGIIFSEASSVALRIHNLPLGMADARDPYVVDGLVSDAVQEVKTFEGIVASIAVRRERALEEVNADWTCSQEIANRLLQDAGVDFRTAHRFASALVTEARNAGWIPATVTREAVGSVWQAFRVSQPEALQAEMPEAFPLSIESWLKATDPKAILEARATAGSANPARVARRLEEIEAEIGEAEETLQGLIRRREEADRRLEAAVRRLLEE